MPNTPRRIRRLLKSRPGEEPDRDPAGAPAQDSPAGPGGSGASEASAGSMGAPRERGLRGVSPWDELEGMEKPRDSAPGPAPSAGKEVPHLAPSEIFPLAGSLQRDLDTANRPEAPAAPVQQPAAPAPMQPPISPATAPAPGMLSPWRDLAEPRFPRWKAPAPETSAPLNPASEPSADDGAAPRHAAPWDEPAETVDSLEESPNPEPAATFAADSTPPVDDDAPPKPISYREGPVDSYEKSPTKEPAAPVIEAAVSPSAREESPSIPSDDLPGAGAPWKDLPGRNYSRPMVPQGEPARPAVYPARLSDRLLGGVSSSVSASQALGLAASSRIARADTSPSQWRLPSRGLLAAPETYAAPQASLEQMARHIEGTLSEHGVMVECSDIQAGPRIVRFGLVPGWVAKRGDSRSKGGAEGSGERSRVKVQSVLTREKDLALALRTPYLRIEPAVPGEGFIGLEVPNPSPGKVPLRNVMDGPPFAAVAARGGLPIALGEDAGGAPVVLDLAALPHALIAGATGSGKSVCINSIVASLLFTKPPDQLRMLMVDPKRVELTPFNGIPHLIAPVITEGEEVNPALRGVMREMFRRYKLMEEVGARNIGGYNAKGREAMPFLVVVVDELADLMMVGGFEVEQNLVRLAQLGRATGIHLVLATQRPSVNVVTGLLKANIPARVAFAVASQVDSRVILDGVGAEKLLGKGDMLLLSHESPKPRRVQGTLVLDEEVDQVVEFWQREKGPPLPVISIEDGEEEEEVVQVDRDLLEQARELALHHPNLSPSLLQRRLNIGELKAREILEVLEEESRVFPV